MSAVFVYEDEYKLNVEIEQMSENLVFRREERKYSFNNVWNARNSYEDLFKNDNARILLD